MPGKTTREERAAVQALKDKGMSKERGEDRQLARYVAARRRAVAFGERRPVAGGSGTRQKVAAADRKGGKATAAKH
jgi:hypothetical protein